MKCNTLYSSNHKGFLAARVFEYLKNQNFDIFSKNLQNVGKFTISMESDDDSDELKKSRSELYRDVEEIIRDYISRNREKYEIPGKKLLNLIHKSLYLGADNTQSAPAESDVEIKTLQEFHDINRGNLDNHLQQIYGSDSYGILRQLSQDFKDTITSAVYIDSSSSAPVEMTNSVLNTNLEKVKENLLNVVRQYLISEGVDFEDSYLGIQNAFYDKITNLENSNDILKLNYQERLSESDKKRKKDLFGNLIDLLQSDPDYKKLTNKLVKYNKSRLEKMLYQGDEYSSSYYSVKELIQEKVERLKETTPSAEDRKYVSELVSYINEIESVKIDLLAAANAYSMFTYFDEFLTEAVGNQISIQKGTFGLNIPGKYQHKQDTAHQIKSWQFSEDIGSEKHTSKFTQLIMSQIRIIDHKTDTYKNRRLDSTQFIVAARHLIDDILYGNLTFSGDGFKIDECRQIIYESAITSHSNPQTTLQRLLELLFDVTPGKNSVPLAYSIASTKLLNPYDLDVLYSLYLRGFNLNDPRSFASQELVGYNKNNIGLSLMQELAAYVDSNITMDYLEVTIDDETGETQTKVKRKYFIDKQLNALRNEMNRMINDVMPEVRAELQKNYEFKMEEPLGYPTQYMVKVAGQLIKLTINNRLKAQILTQSSKPKDIQFIESDIFKEVADVNILDFQNALSSDNPKFTEKELKFKQLLQFIQDYLGINLLNTLGLQTLYVYQQAYKPINNMNNYLMPLVQMAIRMAYINKQYLDAGEKPLISHLENDSLFKIYQKDPKSKLFTILFGDAKYVAASYIDTVLDQWVDAMSVFSGQASKATTKDGQNNHIPNNSVGKLGGLLHYYTHKQLNTNCESLLFASNSHLVKSTFHDLEAYNIHRDTKSVKQFSCGELFYHAIFNKFWGNYNNTGNVIIQPTVYSDKTTFLNWEIATKLDGKIDLLKSKDYISTVLKQYKLTIGEYYAKVYQDTQQKLNKIAEKYNSNNSTFLSTKEVLRMLSPDELIDYGQQLGFDLEVDKDYRVRKRNIGYINELGETVVDEVEYCTFNEILEYNARIYNNEALLREYLEREKYNFLQNLIDFNTSFQVLDYKDSVYNYTKKDISPRATSKTPILHTILSNLETANDRIEFFKNWVDAKTGKLILAKQGNRNILGIGKDFDANEPGMVLNPFLEKFFYVESLYSNNLRLSLTGSEINHPDKAKGVAFNMVKSAKNFGDFTKVVPFATFEQYQAVNDVLVRCDDVSDLYNFTKNTADESVKQILQYIYDKSLVKITNVAQGTQFKRNVIIPATLQYCQQGVFTGVPSTCKCACIYDEQAPVHNYRGDSKEIDSADGSAKITPFQSILENNSLGSQAVGFIKKPIWHSYDTSSGTSFLAKFATNTMTNEEMRASLYSSTSMYKLFKQMTNIPWDEPIDLVKPMHVEKSSEDDNLSESAHYLRWFKEVILQKQRLFYKNKYGEIVEILEFKKSTVTIKDPVTLEDKRIPLYYTKEKVKYGEEKVVYHMFNEQSEHYTFDSVKKAKEAAQQNYHTINSLFELHTSLGGIYCVNEQGEGSEFSNQVVVNYMNNIGNKIKNPDESGNYTKLINQTTCYQPLKKYHIGYALNSTAVKNGAKNMNPEEAWKGDMKLRYFEVDTDGLGMQMNADHDVVDSELTEFSQVIAATAAYGFTYDNCHEIFKGLAKTALQASKRIIDATNKFISNIDKESQSDLYDAIGRIILVNGSIKNEETLNAIIKQAVKKIFDKNRNHENDSVKLAFSDSNMYSDFISTLASTINKASIKRKHPGSGYVMVPGYNIITYFEIGDKRYNHQEMVDLATKDFKEELLEIAKNTEHYDPETKKIDGKFPAYIKLHELIALVGNPALLNSDEVTFRKLVVKHYLDKVQKQQPTYYSTEYFQPEDAVVAYVPQFDMQSGLPLLNGDGSQVIKEERYYLDSMDSYYKFKRTSYPRGTTFKLDVSTPRNLKPSLIRWRYDKTVDLNSIGIVRSEEYQKPWRDDPTQVNTAFTLSLAEDPLRKFEIVKDHEEGYWSIHFKTIADNETFETAPKLTEDQKQRLFAAAASLIPVGDKLSTWGSLTQGGVSGLDRFKNLGFKQVGVRTVQNVIGENIEIPVYEKIGYYMNIFDHPVIRDTFLNKKNRDANYQEHVQQVLHNLHQGFFVMEDGVHNIIPNSLENTEAELVLSNMYKNVFGVENQSLQVILDQGEKFFLDQIRYNVNAPCTNRYDVAMLKDNGQHTLLSFSNVVTDEYCIEKPFTEISVEEEYNEKYDRHSYPIYSMKGNRRQFKIGEYVYLTQEEQEDLYINESGDVVSRNNNPINQQYYRIYNGVIQKRVDFIQRYELHSQAINKKTKQPYFQKHTLYKIISHDELFKLYGDEKSVHNQIGKFITDIYLQDNYKFIELNVDKGREHLNQIGRLKSYFHWFKTNDFVNASHKEFIDQQLNNIDPKTRNNLINLKDLKKQFYSQEAHKKWVSFQDSLKFIAARIPAQTLQSFMTMKCVGWTENDNNMAYVSHFQTYLQGSDYDIDKAYIMGQSYDSNGIYVKWSPLFDYTDLKTLEISKTLPSPEQLILNKTDQGIDITKELGILLQNTDDNLEPLSYNQRLLVLTTYVDLLRKINRYGGNINYQLEESDKLRAIFNKLYQHITYPIPENVAEAAYKNVASANIYAVSHDIRNRDQSYTDINMRILQRAAEKSPKGEQAATLNMLNPLTKYIMQYQNLVGKNVISIAANGEKVWFNAYYYWTKLLKENRTERLQFQTTLYRVKGRAQLDNKNLSQLPKEGNTVSILPDLNKRDREIKQSLLQSFGVDLDNEAYAYVDQLISQLLSAATDNAKELILAKINSGNNFARMYVYLIMTGYNFDDIVSFMISPVSEFIDSMANPNMFSDLDLNNNASSAVDLAQGIVKSQSFLHGSIEIQGVDEATGEEKNKNKSKLSYVSDKLAKSKYFSQVKALLKLEEEDDFDLDTLMSGFIQLSLVNPEINITKLISVSDMEINTYLQYCQNIAYKLKDVSEKYEQFSEMIADAVEFKKIYNLATEISSIASAWLGLNQGLPTDELGILKRFNSMRKTITNREKSLGLDDKKMFTTSTNPDVIAKAQRYFNKVVEKIADNNPQIPTEEIVRIVKDAHEKGLIRTFDIYRYLTDMQYRQDMIEYNHIIKGTLNVLDMMEEIPHYKEIIKCFRALVVPKHYLSSKSRLITSLMQESNSDNLDDKQLRGIIRYADKLNALNFSKSIGIIDIKQQVQGFDNYYSKTPVSKFDLATFDGIMSFKHWIEHEFLHDLKTKHGNNPLVKHLRITMDNNMPILSTDVDLLNPDTTTISRQSFDEILGGMAAFEKVYPYDERYSVTDLLQLYNILVNTNQYGSERLTTTFKACTKPTNILNKFLNFISQQDYNYEILQEHQLEDYFINAAPIVSTGTMRFMTDLFIKVKDPVQGYILHRRTDKNEYKPHPLLPVKEGEVSELEKLKRRQNFAEYCPFEMPQAAKQLEIFSALTFEGNATEDTVSRIKNIILDLYSTGKLFVVKDC